MATTAPSKLPSVVKSTAPTRTLAQAQAEAAAAKAAQDKIIAAEKAAAAARAPTAPASTLKLPDALATYKQVINNPGSTPTTITDPANGNTYYLVPDGYRSAQWYGATRGSPTAMPVLNPTTKPTLSTSGGATVATLTAQQKTILAADAARIKTAADQAAADKAAAAKAAVEKAAADKAAAERAAAEKAAAAKAAAEKAAVEKAAAEKAAADKIAAEKAAAAKLIADQAAAKAAAEKAAAEQKAAEERTWLRSKEYENQQIAARQEAERAAIKQAAADKAAADARAAYEASPAGLAAKAAEKAAAEKAAADKIAADKAAAEKAAADKIAADKAAAERAAAEKAAADKIIADKAAADKAAADKAAADKAAYDATPAGKAAAAEAKRIDQYKSYISNAKTTAELNRQLAIAKVDRVPLDPAWVETAMANMKATEIGKPFQAELAKVTTQAQLDDVVGRLKSAGGQVEQTYIDRVQTLIDRTQSTAEAKAQEEKTALAQAQWQEQVNSAAKTGNVDKVNSLIDQAKSAGQWNLNQGVTDGYVRNANYYQQQNEKTQSDFATAQKTVSGMQNLTLDSKINLSSLDQSIQKDPDLLRLTDNGRIPLQMSDPTAPGYIGAIQLANYYRSGDVYAKQRQAAYEYASKLAPPTQAQNINNEKGSFVGVPDDPTTEANEAGWYSLNSGANTVQKIGADGQPVGGPVSPKELQATTDQIRQNTQAYQLAQQAETARQAELLLATNVNDFESKLPTPQEFMSSGRQSNILRGPDGSDYFLTAADKATGAAPKWVKMDQNMGGVTVVGTDQKQSVSDYNKAYAATQATNNQIEAAERAAAAAQQRKDNEISFGNFIKSDFGKLFTVAVIGSVIGPMIGDALAGAASTSEVAGAAAGMAESGATASEIASAMEAAGLSTEAATAVAETATGITSGAIDVQALGAANGVTTEAVTAAASSANPLAAVNTTLVELNAAQTAELMRNIDPNLIGNFVAPGTSGTAGGTVSSLLSGQSLNPITNIVTNLGITDPIISGALTGAGTSTAINLLTGQPVTGQSILQGALGGGVAGGIGANLPDMGGGTIGSALAGAATNVGATVVVNAVTGQPITGATLAGAALTGGVIGAAVPMVTDGLGNTTYQYDDGSSMTVNRGGTPVAVTDSSGVNVPVAGVDTRTGEPKKLVPVEDAVPSPVNPTQPVPGDLNAGPSIPDVPVTPVATAPVAPGTVSPTQPVGYEPGVGVPAVESPFELRSYGQGDTPGQVSAGADGERYLTLDSGKVVKLTDYQAAIDSGRSISVDGQIDTQFKVESSGVPKFSGMPGAATPPEGYEVAKPGDVNGPDDSGSADKPFKPGTYYDPATNTWFTPVAPPAPIAPIDTTGIDTGPTIPVTPIDTAPVIRPPIDTTGIDTGPTIPVTPIDTAPVTPGPTTPIDTTPAPVDTTPGPVGPPVVTTPVDTTPGPTAPVDTTPAPVPGDFDSGPSIPGVPVTPVVTAPPVNQPYDPYTDQGPSQPGVVTPGPVGPPGDTVTDLGTVPIVDKRPVTPPDIYTPPPLDNTVVNVDVTPPATPKPEPIMPSPDDDFPPTPEPPMPSPDDDFPPTPDPTPVTPPVTPPVYPPIYVPQPPVVTPPPLAPLPPLNWGDVGRVNLPGTNPGWFTNVPEQYAPQGIRSQYYWGQHPYQTGERFSPEQYRQVPAPVAPWGLQQMYTPQTIEDLLRGVGKASAVAPYNQPSAPRV
jgi:hypothetical protein